MTKTEIAADLRRHTGGSMISPKQLAEYMGVKSVWRVREKFLSGLEHVGDRYFILEVAERIKEKTKI